MRVRNIGRDSERQKERFWKSMYMRTKRTTREIEYSDKSNNAIASIQSKACMYIGSTLNNNDKNPLELFSPYNSLR